MSAPVRGGPLRIVVAVAVVAVLSWIGWRTIQATRADLLARDNPEAALRIDPDHPDALLTLAWQQLGANDTRAATATARHLLKVEPGQGDAFAILALAATARGDADAPRLLDIAVRRAPRVRDVRMRAALAALKAGHPAAMMAQLDALLRLSPDRGETLFPMFAQQAQNPAFADVLVSTLVRDPPWRPRFMATLAAAGVPSASLDNVYDGLRRHGELPQRELAAWFNRMLADGRWGDAFARWLGTLGPGVAQIPPVRNGGFEQDITGIGFDWRNDPVKGVFATIEDGAGVGGSRAAHLHFIGQAARGNLFQPLILGPGRYHLSLQARADFLRSDQGLQWVVQCDRGRRVATLGGLEGSFDWRRFEVDFEVPATGCAGQWLVLRNPAVPGSARQVSGDVWFDEIEIKGSGSGDAEAAPSPGT